MPAFARPFPAVAQLVGVGMNWQAVEDVLLVWVKRATGYADGQVIWAEQSGSRPLDNIVTLKIAGVRNYTDYPELATDTDDSRPPGTEVRMTAVIPKIITVTVTAYGSQTIGNAASYSILSACQTAALLPSVQQVFEDANIAFWQAGSIQNISLANHTRFESRAACDFEFYTSDEIVDFAGYIETVVTDDYMGAPLSDLGTPENIDIP